MINRLKIKNNGPEIVETNYWQSKYAARGDVFLSINAGCFRLLVPQAPASSNVCLQDIWSAEVVLVSRGPWPEAQAHDALEVLFDNGSEASSSLQMAANQCDRLPLANGCDLPGTLPRWRCMVYTEDGLICDLPARYRLADRIPCLKGWKP